MQIATGGLGFSRIVDLDRGTECRETFSSIENTVREIFAADLIESLDATGILAAFDVVSARLPLPQNRSQRKAPPPADPSLLLISESAKSPHASDYLLSISGPTTTMKDAEFRDAVRLRLGLAAAVGHCSCTPSPQDDRLGVHRLG